MRSERWGGSTRAERAAGWGAFLSAPSRICPPPLTPPHHASHGGRGTEAACACQATRKGECCYNPRMSFETRLTPAMIARHIGSGWWGKDTIYGLLAARVAAHPEREAIVDAKRRVTYRELKDGIDRTAAVLKAQGIGGGDVVTVQLPNWIEFACVFFALELI